MLRYEKVEEKDIQFFKQLLNDRLQELLSQANSTVSGLKGNEDHYADPTDQAAVEADINFQLRIRDRENRLIKKIQTALERIENGVFGICETCGDEISIERLKARPVTTQCIECKSKEERQEKLFG